MLGADPIPASFENRPRLMPFSIAAMTPPATVCGLYFAHPEAAYFNAGLLTRDQIEDYAARKGMPVVEVERWLGPSLAYDPAPVSEAA